MEQNSGSHVPSLNSFGSILAFAIDLEATLARFYEASAASVGERADRFGGYAQKSAKRKSRLIAIRQDNVTEMVLEPIMGLDAANYIIGFVAPTDGDSALAEAIRLEAVAERFYREAGAKLNVTEPRRAFQKMAQENADRVAELTALHA